MSPERVDDGESVLVGQVVADEDRRAPAERFFFQVFPHCFSLVLSTGLELDDSLSGENCVLGTHLGVNAAHGAVCK
jgi:hypothetical protein